MATFSTNHHDSVLRQPSPSKKIDQSRAIDYVEVQDETCALYGTEEYHETAAFQTLDDNERYEVPDALGNVHQCVRISNVLLRGTQWMF